MRARIKRGAGRCARECSIRKALGCMLCACRCGCYVREIQSNDGESCYDRGCIPPINSDGDCLQKLRGKEEKAMFRAHSAACQAQSQVEPRLVEALLAGELANDPALRRHVYCVLLKCKVVGKDGKLLKSAVLGKLAVRSDGRNATKALEQCADQSADSASSPEDVAWNLFRCGYDRKAVLFDYMPSDADE